MTPATILKTGRVTITDASVLVEGFTFDCADGGSASLAAAEWAQRKILREIVALAGALGVRSE